VIERQVLEGVPCPTSAATLLGVDPSALSPDDAVVVVLAGEKLIRAVQAVQAEAMVAAAGPRPEPDPDTGREPLDDAAEWLAVDLGGSRAFQLDRIDTARYLRRWLPRTSAAMRAGEWGWYEAGLLVRAAQSLTRPELIGRLEDRIVPRGTVDLARRIRRAVARLDPAGVADTQRKARASRSLRYWKDRFGEQRAGFGGEGPSELVALIAAALDLDARPNQPDDCRTIDMRRFDVLTDWARQRLGLPTENHHPAEPAANAGRTSPGAGNAATAAAARDPAQALLAYAHHHDLTDPDMASADSQPACTTVASADGHPAGPGTASADSHPLRVRAQPGQPLLHQSKRCTSCGRTGPPRVPIAVTVSLDTLLGLSAEPADLTGWGLLDPATAQELASDGTWRRWVCEPTTGHLLDVGATTATRRKPTPATSKTPPAPPSGKTSPDAATPGPPNATTPTGPTGPSDQAPMLQQNPTLQIHRTTNRSVRSDDGGVRADGGSSRPVRKRRSGAASAACRACSGSSPGPGRSG
jgi:hypothetical protein